MNENTFFSTDPDGKLIEISRNTRTRVFTLDEQNLRTNGFLIVLGTNDDFEH